MCLLQPLLHQTLPLTLCLRRVFPCDIALQIFQQMLSGSFELVPYQPQPQKPCAEGVLFVLRLGSGVHGPLLDQRLMRNRQTQLDVAFDLPGVEGGIEHPKLNGSLAYPDEPLYCIEPWRSYGASTSGNSVDRGVTLDGSGSTAGSNVWYAMPEDYREAIGLILLYSDQLWDHSVSVTTTKKDSNPNVPLDAFSYRGLVYESADYHNAVFVGIDREGKPRHIHKHSTAAQGSFKGNAPGSDPEYSFHWVGGGETLFLFEAPIDMLSFISMHKQHWKSSSYAAACGVSDKVLWKTMEGRPFIRNVCICLDNDETGQKAAQRISKALTEKNMTASRVRIIWRILK